MPRKLTKREREVMKEWERHTGFEFMEVQDGESFYDALNRNKQWLEDHTAEALYIGDDIFPPDMLADATTEDDRP